MTIVKKYDTTIIDMSISNSYSIDRRKDVDRMKRYDCNSTT